MSHRTLSVAERLRVESDAAGHIVTPMHLLKLAYIAHGFVLAKFDRPLLDERVEAWQYGPVVPSIYHALKAYGNQPVDTQVPGSQVKYGFGDDESETMRDVARIYGKYRATVLSSATHAPGTPWYETWNAEGKSAPIPDALIRDFYRQILKSRKHSSL
jgi:uncharacterized phage-associated protein